jgi:hypothetical protein
MQDQLQCGIKMRPQENIVDGHVVLPFFRAFLGAMACD